MIPTGILHEATGTSFNKTEHEPQEPLEHPHFTEVQPLFCNTFIRVQSGSASRIFSSSFKITGIFKLSLLFFVINKSKLNLKTNLKEMIAVYKSEMSQNGQFSPMVISSSYLDFGEKTMPIGIDLYLKYNKVGSYETSLNQLLSNECISINIAGYSLFAKAREFERQRKTFKRHRE